MYLKIFLRCGHPRDYRPSRAIFELDFSPKIFNFQSNWENRRFTTNWDAVNANGTVWTKADSELSFCYRHGKVAASKAINTKNLYHSWQASNKSGTTFKVRRVG